jgi:drug/metabolite transporter (DMT)-like permease
VAAVLLACLSAVLFGSMTVVLRFALRRDRDAEAGSLVTVWGALVVCLAGALIDPGRLSASQLWPFFVVGMLAPGAAQLFFTRAIREAGASRVSVTVGAAPLISVSIALVFLGEPLRAGLVAGAVLIVLGGVALIRERIRPETFRWAGIGLAIVGTVLFSTRDNIVRWLAGDTKVAPLAAATTALVGGALFIVLYLTVTRRRPPLAGFGRDALAGFGLAGIVFGLSYGSLFEAFYRGRVTVVSPLVATESLWGVLFSLLLLRRSELVSRHLLVGAALIVGGGVLIGATR